MLTKNEYRHFLAFVVSFNSVFHGGHYQLKYPEKYWIERETLTNKTVFLDLIIYLVCSSGRCRTICSPGVRDSGDPRAQAAGSLFLSSPVVIINNVVMSSSCEVYKELDIGGLKTLFCCWHLTVSPIPQVLLQPAQPLHSLTRQSRGSKWSKIDNQKIIQCHHSLLWWR